MWPIFFVLASTFLFVLQASATQCHALLSLETYLKHRQSTEKETADIKFQEGRSWLDGAWTKSRGFISDVKPGRLLLTLETKMPNNFPGLMVIEKAVVDKSFRNQAIATQGVAHAIAAQENSAGVGVTSLMIELTNEQLIEFLLPFATKEGRQVSLEDLASQSVKKTAAYKVFTNLGFTNCYIRQSKKGKWVVLGSRKTEHPEIIDALVNYL